MRNLLLAAFFLVSWNEYELKPVGVDIPLGDIMNVGDCPSGSVLVMTDKGLVCRTSEISTVEEITHTVKLATQKDVDLFIGKRSAAYYDPFSDTDHKEEIIHAGLISSKAFNIKVEKVDK